jgi:O-glycosyl hydrolase
VTDGKRTKEIWQTEMSGVKWWPEQGTGTGGSLKGSDTIETAVAVAGWIHSALTVGEASAWLWWWYSAYNTDDNEGLLVQNSSKLTRRYYALGNYSKFVRPGYTHVHVTGTAPTDVLLSAYKGSDGTVVVVAINKGPRPRPCPSPSRAVQRQPP